MCSLISGLVIAFAIAPLYAIATFAFFPLLFVVSGLMGKKFKMSLLSKMMATKKLGGIVEETLSATKLVISLANEDKEVDKFIKSATEVKKETLKSDKIVSIFIGVIKSMMF